MKVSIIIPVYNAERTLERCVNSVLRQTYRAVSYTHLTLPTICSV